MTETEYRLKYPIGTKIKYVPKPCNVTFNARKDIGKQGTVTGHCYRQVRIHLPTSEKQSKTWRTLWKSIVPISQKNQQLLFSFMD